MCRCLVGLIERLLCYDMRYDCYDLGFTKRIWMYAAHTASLGGRRCIAYSVDIDIDIVRIGYLYCTRRCRSCHQRPGLDWTLDASCFLQSIY